MNRILVEISIGELLDKISILEIKSEKIKDINKLNYINNECKNGIIEKSTRAKKRS